MEDETIIKTNLFSPNTYKASAGLAVHSFILQNPKQPPSWPADLLQPRQPEMFLFEANLIV